MNETLAQGVFCVACGFFELEEGSYGNQHCRGCGCELSAHVPAKVVAVSRCALCGLLPDALVHNATANGHDYQIVLPR